MHACMRACVHACIHKYKGLNDSGRREYFVLLRKRTEWKFANESNI